ncbi:hypothetical protein LIER_39456 [Lithospermum erythrorhizon]|uniref:Uncharacterized protein n=1 Tax=Lithospermum erythrorhizon TaxID=34254 RepID=A0AAV3QHD0_LITER
MRPILLEGLCKEYSGSESLDVFGSMCRSLVQASLEFVDALGANVAFGALSFVRSDFAEFQKDYESSWFTVLDLDASSSGEEDDEEPPLLAMPLLPLSFVSFLI